VPHNKCRSISATRTPPLSAHVTLPLFLDITLEEVKSFTRPFSTHVTLPHCPELTRYRVSILCLHFPRSRQTLIVLLEGSLMEAIRLDCAGEGSRKRDSARSGRTAIFASPWIDLDAIARLRGGSSLAAVARESRRLARDAIALSGGGSRAFWCSEFQRVPGLIRGLRSQPFYKPAELGWASRLLGIFGEIKSELEGVLRAPPAGSGGGGWDEVGSRHDSGDREIYSGAPWTELVLFNTDPLVSETAARNRRRCPATASFISSLVEATDMAERGIGEVTFSALGPGCHLHPHCGSTNARLTCHLPLLVPKGAESDECEGGDTCAIRVADETRVYREGELMVFDDSFEHEVWNRHASETRVVLLIRFWHPEIEPERYATVKRSLRQGFERHRRAAQMPPLDTPMASTSRGTTPKMEASKAEVLV